jgi:hypothetical protein
MLSVGPAALQEAWLSDGVVDEVLRLCVRRGLVLVGLRWGAVKELDLKEKVESCRWPGWPHVPQATVSFILDTGRIISNSASHWAQ